MLVGRNAFVDVFGFCVACVLLLFGCCAIVVFANVVDNTKVANMVAANAITAIGDFIGLSIYCDSIS
jgi:hypothetical protein